MKGTVGLQGLRIRCIIGILPQEREAEQDLVLDVALDQDFAPSAHSESVDDTVDYAVVAELLTELATRKRFQLIETFAEQAAALLLDRFDRVTSARIEVRKPAAVPAADAAYVRLERSRP